MKTVQELSPCAVTSGLRMLPIHKHSNAQNSSQEKVRGDPVSSGPWDQQTNLYMKRSMMLTYLGVRDPDAEWLSSCRDATVSWLVVQEAECRDWVVSESQWGNQCCSAPRWTRACKPWPPGWGQYRAPVRMPGIVVLQEVVRTTRE